MDEYPLTRQYLGEIPPGAGSALERVNARYSGPMIVDRAARDLARYESERARLRAAPALAPHREPLPAEDAKLRLAPDVCLLTFGADLPRMLEELRAGKATAPRPCRGWILLVPEGGRVAESRIARDDEGWLLEWFRDPTSIAEVMPMAGSRAPFEHLWKKGLLVRA